MLKIIKIMRCAHVYDSNSNSFTFSWNSSTFFLFIIQFILRVLSLSVLRNRSLFGLFFHCKMVRREWKRNNRLLGSACNSTKLTIDSIPHGVNTYARNCVCRPLPISSSPLNILDCVLFFVVQYSSPLCFSIDRLISKTGKYTSRNENATMELTHLFQLLFM